METWIVHHTNTTIHRCAANAPALPSHLDDIDFRGAEIFTRIPARGSSVISHVLTAIMSAVRSAKRLCSTP